MGDKALTGAWVVGGLLRWGRPRQQRETTQKKMLARDH